MKNFLPAVVATLIVLFGFQASAEVIIYHGTSKLNYTGEDHAWSVNLKMFLIVDHDTAEVRRIEYANVNGHKYYATSHYTNLHFMTVNAPKARTITVISRPPSQCAISEGFKNDSVFILGANSTITISTNSTLSFPRIVSARGDSVFVSNQSGEPIVSNANMTSNFDKKNTLASNAAGENLEDAFFRLRSFVQSLGYSLAPGETDEPEVSAMDAFRSAAKPEFESVR